MVDVDEVRCCRDEFASVERGVCLSDERPRFRTARGFACSEPCVELVERCVEVLDVEHHDRRGDRLRGVQFDEVEHLGFGAHADQHEPLPSGRHDPGADVAGPPPRRALAWLRRMLRGRVELRH